jgi:UDPglucose--hexose-1-phosphate uridylyltransferase
VIFENKDFIAFTFYAARFPFEIWIMPKVHESRYENEPKIKYSSLAECLIDVFGKLNKTLNDPPVNFYIHNLPNTIQETDYYHWHIEIAPRVSGYGGYEMGSGNIINVVSPEQCAKYLLEKK